MDISAYIEIYGKDLTNLCISLCKNKFDAQDLYQSTWEKVIRKHKKYNPDLPFDKWLYRICINTHKDMLKSPFRRRNFEFNTSEELENVLNSVTDTEVSKDDFIALHQAISKLSLEKRQVVALYYFKDLNTKEIASILEIPEGTVKSRLSSAREQIRKELNDA